MILKLIPNRVKVWFLKHLYADIAGMGDGGDTELAHVNLKEVAILKAHGGAGTINPRTGLVEFKGKGGGGGGGQPTESTSYSTNLPEYAQPFYEELLKQAGKETYTTDSAGNVTGVNAMPVYGGTEVADFNVDQTGAQAATRTLGAPSQIAQATTGLTDAMTTAGTAVGGITDARAFVPGTITDETITTEKFTDPGVAASYMDPYQQNVTDIQLAEARRQGDIAKASRGLASIGRGTFGGGRQALMESEADRALASQLGSIQATGSQQAYQRGQQAFTQDQARNLQMQQANQAADLQAQQLAQQGQQFGAGLQRDLGLAGLQTGLQGSQALGTLGGLQQQTDLQRIQAQAASGAEQQALEQERLNVAKQRFLEEENAKRAMLEYQSNILRGTAGALGSTRTQYTPQPSMASQIGGLGLAGLGLYNMLGRG